MLQHPVPFYVFTRYERKRMENKIVPIRMLRHWRGLAGDMRSRSRKRRRCLHGYNVGKQALHQEFTQKTVELRASTNADAATQRYVKTCGKDAKRLYCHQKKLPLQISTEVCSE